MTAFITVNPAFDLASIAAAAGNSSIEARRYVEGRLYVEGVDQAGLDLALASYDSNAALVPSRISASNAAYEAATNALTADYPQMEKDTWPTQNEQAAAWVADPMNAATPWIDRAAAERGIDREEYLRRTLVKAEQFKILSAFLTGRRQRYEDQIKAGNDPVLDYALTNDVLLALQQVSETIMATPSADMQAALA